MCVCVLKVNERAKEGGLVVCVCLLTADERERKRGC